MKFVLQIYYFILIITTTTNEYSEELHTLPLCPTIHVYTGYTLYTLSTLTGIYTREVLPRHKVAVLQAMYPVPCSCYVVDRQRGFQVIEGHEQGVSEPW